MKNFEGISKHDLDHLALEARVHFLEARNRAVQSVVFRALKDLGLKEVSGLPVETFVEQQTERILQETLRGLADHDPQQANKLAAFWADVKKPE